MFLTGFERQASNIGPYLRLPASRDRSRQGRTGCRCATATRASPRPRRGAAQPAGSGAAGLDLGRAPGPLDGAPGATAGWLSAGHPRVRRARPLHGRRPPRLESAGRGYDQGFTRQFDESLKARRAWTKYWLSYDCTVLI
jgi:hypothetical protein